MSLPAADTGEPPPGTRGAHPISLPPLTVLPSVPGLDVDVWLVDLDAPDWQALHGVLSTQERERADQFRFPHLSVRYRASRAALRSLLAQCTGVPAQALRFEQGSHGKPSLSGVPLHFNLSHSGAWGLMGVCREAPIGVDLELLAPLNDEGQLARRNFTAAEYRAFLQAPAGQRLETFFQSWTRKEACLKAIGSGLSIEPHEFEAGVTPDRRDTFVPSPQGRCEMSVAGQPLPAHGPPALAAVARVHGGSVHRVF